MLMSLLYIIVNSNSACKGLFSTQPLKKHAMKPTPSTPNCPSKIIQIKLKINDLVHKTTQK